MNTCTHLPRTELAKFATVPEELGKERDFKLIDPRLLGPSGLKSCDGLVE